MTIKSSTAARCAITLGAGLLMWVNSAAHSSESVDVSDHVLFNTDTVVDGATVLVRDRNQNSVTANLSSRALEPDTAYSIWWAVFNQPQYCAEQFNCVVNDLEVFGGDSRIQASVFWAGGVLSDQAGIANISLNLRQGTTTRELFAQTEPHGLQNLMGAEIHLVLRTHGPAGVAGRIAEQIGSANMGCPPDDCQLVLASIHRAEMTDVNTSIDNCDFSAASVNSGWGWDPIAMQSCPPRS